MKFKIAHSSKNVFDLKKSVAFYEKALDFKETRRIDPGDGSFLIIFMGDGTSGTEVELTWSADHSDRPYDLGENEQHLAVTTEDYAGAHALHEQMGVVCYENREMGLYFINDPDGYWIEILPA
ncbi:MAG: VOC family protein [Clostridiaceae bacterium]|jgi:lactoylglutathione lyase|nr:VOC family protein [Clostridiaceae bacterium]